MSQTVSPSSNKAYGVRRVCSVWKIARSTVYWQKQLEPSTSRRGPQGPHTDAELLLASRKFLEESPFHGEGYRKVHAALRLKGLRASPARIMRLMRENASGEACRQAPRPQSS
jgi:hypothetical protein